MKRYLAILLVIAFAFTAIANSSSQIEWGGGPMEQDAVTSWGDTFYGSENINFYYFGELYLAFEPNLSSDINNIGSVNGAYFVDVGDIDGDGNNDVVASSSNTQTFVWFRSNGDGTFDSTARLIGSIQYAAFDIVDLDEDGDGDIIIGIDTAAGSDRVSWFQNDGSGNFTEIIIDNNFSQVDSGVAVDFDHDGDLDLFFGAYQSSPLRWYENDGSENFTIHTLVASGHSGPENIGIDVGDFNADGYVDVAFACRNNGEVVWWEYDENYTDPTAAFLEHVIATGLGEAYSCTTIDIDWDGDPDLVTSSRTTNRIDWWENDGTGNFTQHYVTNSYSSCRQAVPLDVDYDGDIDVLSATEGSSTLDWWENDGSFSFTQRTFATGYSGAHGITTGEILQSKSYQAVTTANTGDTADYWDIIGDFRPHGTLDSAILDSGYSETLWGNFTWSENEPADTAVNMYIRGGDSVSAVEGASWDGPHAGGFNSGTVLTSNPRYFQYRLEFTTSNPDHSPNLNWVNINYQDHSAVTEVILNSESVEEGILMSWEAIGDAAGFDLFRAPASGSDNELAYERVNNSRLPGNRLTVYLDASATAGESYAYKIRAIATDGVISWHGPIIATALPGAGERMSLAQSHPNPASEYTTISFELPVSTNTRLQVFDLSGRLVSTLVNEELSAGRHSVMLDTSTMPSGVYLYRLEADGESRTERLTIAR